MAYGYHSKRRTYSGYGQPRMRRTSSYTSKRVEGTGQSRRYSTRRNVATGAVGKRLTALTKKVASLTQRERKKVVLVSADPPISAFLCGHGSDADGKSVPLHDCNYLLVPVTQAIPPMPAPDQVPSLKRWAKNTVHIAGVTVQFSIHAWQNVELGAVLYFAGGGELVVPQAPMDSPDGLPTQFSAMTKNGSSPARPRTLRETGFLDGRGPFELRNDAIGVPVLDSTSGAMFSAKLREGDGGPVGTVSYKLLNTDQKGWGRSVSMVIPTETPPSGDVMDGRVFVGSAPANNVRLYFKVNESVSYVRKTSSDVVSWKEDLQICLMLRSAGRIDDTEDEIVAAEMRDLLVKVYYS